LGVLWEWVMVGVSSVGVVSVVLGVLWEWVTGITSEMVLEWELDC
jgi:hypothetical protein